MPMRYLMIVGARQTDDQIAAVQATAAMLEQALGFHVIVETPQVTILANAFLEPVRFQTGIVIGWLFRRGREGSRTTVFTPDERSDILERGSLSLVRNFWGGFVAAAWNADMGTVQILRDPSGALPCYYMSWGDLTLVASDVEGLFLAARTKPGIDWRYIAEHLTRPHYRPIRTALCGVTELLAGTRLCLSAEKTGLSEIWSPWHFAADSTHNIPMNDLAEQLHTVIVQSVQAWASAFRHIVLSISGGLDSSIVAFALSQSSTPYTGINFVARDAAGDEREYARLLSQTLQFPLVEAAEEAEKIDIFRSDAAHLPRPIARSFAQSGDRNSLALAASVGADGFMGGGGGDNVFCFLQSPSPVADRLISQGLTRGVLETAIDIGRMAESSAVELLWKGARRAWLRAPGYRWSRVDRFLSREAKALAKSMSYHPWLAAPAHALPGKAAHIASLIAIQNHLEGFNRERVYPFIAPLMSQPVMECCLGIPSWMWFADGQNRILARQAFRGHLPEIITQRRSKGTPGGFVAEVYAANRSKIWEILSQGLLARERFLDMEALRTELRSDAPPRGLTYTRIMELVDVETWLACWH